jgi:hypothetical protein
MFRRAICGGALKERFGCLAQRPGVTGSSVITSGPLVLPGMMGLLGVTLSRENDTAPYFSPEYTPRKTQWLCRRLLFRTGFPAYRR